MLLERNSKANKYIFFLKYSYKTIYSSSAYYTMTEKKITLIIHIFVIYRNHFSG